MFVGARDHPHVAAAHPLEPRHRVGGDRLIGMADMRATLGIADRGGDVDGGLIRGHARPLAAAGREGKYCVSARGAQSGFRSEAPTSGLQSLMRPSYAVLCLKKKTSLHFRHHLK